MSVNHRLPSLLEPRIPRASAVGVGQKKEKHKGKAYLPCSTCLIVSSVRLWGFFNSFLGNKLNKNSLIWVRLFRLASLRGWGRMRSPIEINNNNRIAIILKRLLARITLTRLLEIGTNQDICVANLARTFSIQHCLTVSLISA